MRDIAALVLLGALLAGCATATPTGLTPVDITGAWSGSWEGYGVVKIKRHDNADARFTQRGVAGTGRLWLEGILASESIPLRMRLNGLEGVPVVFEVTGNRVVIHDPRDERIFAMEFAVKGDRMVGRMLTTAEPARIVLERLRPREAVATPPPAPPPPAEPVSLPSLSARPAPQEFAPTEALKPVYFGFDQSTLAPSQIPVMDANVRWLQANPDALAIVEGHCDEHGTEEYNLALGERRARTVRDYLLARGIAAARITLVSYGEERPSCTEHTEACWRENRRAAFVIKIKE
jgi:peptidoglycan-associated lipoprotein